LVVDKLVLFTNSLTNGHMRLNPLAAVATASLSVRILEQIRANAFSGCHEVADRVNVKKGAS